MKFLRWAMFAAMVGFLVTVIVVLYQFVLPISIGLAVGSYLVFLYDLMDALNRKRPEDRKINTSEDAFSVITDPSTTRIDTVFAVGRLIGFFGTFAWLEIASNDPDMPTSIGVIAIVFVFCSMMLMIEIWKCLKELSEKLFLKEKKEEAYEKAAV